MTGFVIFIVISLAIKLALYCWLVNRFNKPAKRKRKRGIPVPPKKQSASDYLSDQDKELFEEIFSEDVYAKFSTNEYTNIILEELRKLEKYSLDNQDFS